MNRSHKILEQKATYEITCATFLLGVRKDGVDSSRCLPAAKSALGVNCNIAATGHKLQGTSKDSLIIGSWNYTFENWIYVVLSRERTLKGLFLCEKMDLTKPFRVIKKVCIEESRLEKIQDEVIKYGCSTLVRTFRLVGRIVGSPILSKK